LNDIGLHRRFRLAAQSPGGPEHASGLGSRR
jgi:hypothetical protein